MRRSVLAIAVIGACVAESPGDGQRPPGRGALAAQDTVTPFVGTLSPVRRPGSLAPMRPALLSAVRAGQEPGFDRVVFEFRGSGLPGYQVEYVPEPIRACGSGEVVSLAGAVRLVVRLEPAQAHDTSGRVTLAERSLAPRLPQVQELRLVCDFEGQVEWAVGLAASRRYRVLEDSQPARLILDVRHRD